jgi:hypothetical protein
MSFLLRLYPEPAWPNLKNQAGGAPRCKAREPDLDNGKIENDLNCQARKTYLSFSPEPDASTFGILGGSGEEGGYRDSIPVPAGTKLCTKGWIFNLLPIDARRRGSNTF